MNNVNNTVAFEPEVLTKQNIPAILLPDVDVFLNSRVLIAGQKTSNLTFLKTLLEISGFSKVALADSINGITKHLGKGVDLLILDSNFMGTSARDLRKLVDQFDQWRLIPMLYLTKESEWDHTQVITDLSHGITSLLYHPSTAESLPPFVMTALAIKKGHDFICNTQKLQHKLTPLDLTKYNLQAQGHHDELTGLADRKQLKYDLEISIRRMVDFNVNSALIYIDLDRLNVLNDIEGHEAGDELLLHVANKLREFFTDNDTLVRMGSDEFAVLINNIEMDQALDKSENLCQLFDQDGDMCEYDEHNYHLSVSIGITFINGEESLTPGDVLTYANQACYSAKKHGRNQVHVYSPDDQEMNILKQRVKWAPRIRSALKDEHFLLEFQPIHSMVTGQVNHYECLLRMKDERTGTIYYPNDFIPVAEAMGLIHQIDLWVVNHAFNLISTIPKDVSITINLSSNIFMDRHLYPLVVKKIAETEVEPSRVIFEITETSAILNFEKTKKMVTNLRILGCRFALDDFGSGFNSYNYLKYFPVDILKIDGAFITDLDDDPIDQLLVKSMIDIAHNLGKETVAEYVEEQSTMDLLASYGIDYIQGFLIGKPQSVFLN